ncbi:DUF2194 domain-containing protein [Paenibacillus aurantiacus]|uniref:DUF2194 domain-containing protein n=1 Tax=Paenibacillus aurantiacus TaxID=1936118 RepID=A0ABV5KNF0_9BACL
MKQFKLSRQVYYILLFVLILTVVLEFTRSQSMLSLGGRMNDHELTGNQGTVNALTAEQVAALDEDKTLLLYDPSVTFSKRVEGNAEHMLGYMKKAHDVVDVAEYEGNGTGYSSVIIAFSDLKKMRNAGWLPNFVERGGRVLFAAMPSVDDVLYSMYRKLGIDELGDYDLTEGIELKTNVLIHSAGDKFSKVTIENTSLQVHLSAESTVHAVDLNGMPLMWESDLGKGKFIVFNGTMLQEKMSRGILAGGINMLHDDDIYPVINTKMMYIDDFPAPLPQGVAKDIFEEYKLDMPRFFKEVWWPDMLRMAAARDLKYTGVVIQSYNNNVKPPFDDTKDSDGTTLVTFGLEVLKRGGEIGIHGYNHQSLTMDPRISAGFGYKPWQSVSDMEEAVRTAKSFINSKFPNYRLHNYVPPSNALTAEGREALKKGWPELQSISAVYAEDPLNLSYVQEFGVASDGIVELPRVTSGYKQDEFNDWAAINTASSIGVFSHFIHPDDILDHERSFPFSWEQLFKMTNDFISKITGRFSWLRSMTASEASVEVERFTLSEPHFVHAADGIEGYVNNYKEGSKLYYILRSEKSITDEVNCKVQRIDDGVYLVEARAAKFTIGLEG